MTEKTIKEQRELLLQAHGVLTRFYEVLLHADGEQAVPYAQAAYVAASLINKSAEELDSVRIWPLIEALKRHPCSEGGYPLRLDVVGPSAPLPKYVQAEQGRSARRGEARIETRCAHQKALVCKSHGMAVAGRKGTPRGSTLEPARV